MTNAPGNCAFPPVLALRDEGVTVFLGQGQHPGLWWPYGDADMLERTMIVGYRSGFVTDDELEIAFDLASASAARVLRLPDYGLVVGAADFVALDARHMPEAVVTRPAKVGLQIGTTCRLQRKVRGSRFGHTECMLIGRAHRLLTPLFEPWGSGDRRDGGAAGTREAERHAAARTARHPQDLSVRRRQRRRRSRRRAGRDPRGARRERRRQEHADEDHLRRRAARRRRDAAGTGKPVAIAQPGARRARSASAWCSSTSRCSRR